ncbi:TolC family protein [Paraglaciecola sp.]|uniref:TolC family protein n=1 Tax=Paraglaciecola sp. TaxID=1920173 RepID=UPI00273DDC33|nr:TolC family protein [Paraglaciecola sp.]MDP5029792.1 TolC family protein [Paraglaciecola sp.]
MKHINFSGLVCAVLLLSACSHLSAVDNTLRQPTLPDNWQQQSPYLAVQDDWLSEFNQAGLSALVEKALNKNLTLKQLAYQSQIEEQQVKLSGAYIWPSLDLSLSQGRGKSVEPTSYATTSSISLDLAYEIDIWGKLSDSQRQANLSYLAQKATFEQAKQQIVADVIVAWFKHLSDKQLSALYQARVRNSEQNLDIIEQGYQQGLNAALDVYLARNDLNSERSRLSQQQANERDSNRALQRLVGEYPDAQLNIESDIPFISASLGKGIPSELITRKPELVASWYQLLAKDAALAFAHKQRFPSLAIGASLSDGGETLSDVLSPASLAWSLIGRISAPLFQGGSLKANEKIALLSLKQSEQAYLDALYSAFNSVESGINQEESLLQQYQATLAARDNAVIAEQLSFEQYQSGLVSYTTVLDAQGRSYDAQSSLIDLKNQLIANRVSLHIALGGNFSTTQLSKSEN